LGLENDQIENAEKSEAPSEKVEFNSWFTAKLQNHAKLRAHHHPVILAFFQLHQLSESEQASKYDEMLKKFGY